MIDKDVERLLCEIESLKKSRDYLQSAARGFQDRINILKDQIIKPKKAAIHKESTALKVLSIAGIRCVSIERKRKAWEMRRDGATYAAIGEELRRSPTRAKQYVYSYLHYLDSGGIP